MKKNFITITAFAVIVIVFVVIIYHKVIAVDTISKKTNLITGITIEMKKEVFIPKDSNGKILNLIDYEDTFKDLIKELKRNDKNFDVKNYKFLVNMHTEDGNDGIIKVYYYIGDKIKTNRIYVAIIENGQISEVTDSLKSNNSNYHILTPEEEKNMIEKVDQFLKESERDKDNTTGEKVKERKTEILYDYLTGELKYIDTKFIVSDELDGAIVDKTIEVEIEY